MAAPLKLTIIGAGGFGRETLDVLKAIDPEGSLWHVVGFVDSAAPNVDLFQRINATYLGNDESFLREQLATHFTVAIGDPVHRRRIVSQYVSAGLTPVRLLHPSATVGSDVTIGLGSIICAQSSLTTNIRIGEHAHVDRASTIGHDCTIGDFASLMPGSVVSGDVRIGNGVRIGANACILPGLDIGDSVTVGAGAVVTKDIPAGMTVAGVPARPLTKD